MDHPRASVPGDDRHPSARADDPVEFRQRPLDVVERDDEPGRWQRRAETLLRTAAGAGVAVLGVAVAEQVTATDLLATSVVAGIVFFLALFALLIALGGVFLIKLAQTCKHTLVPAVHAIRRDPADAVSGFLDRLRRPGETLRESWEEL